MRSRYGAGPLHLTVLLASFALAGAAALKIAPDPLRLRYAAWFLGAVLLHDLVLLPLYTLLDRSATTVLGPRSAVSGAINHLRVPALLSGLLLLLFAPLILQRSEPAYGTASGLTQDAYLGRWLTLTAVLFTTSAALYLVRRRRT